ncbi:glycoside hydrolase family 28 protein [Clavibacter michiganensis]|uniref:PgaA protein n=6 Tax=Clavibacter michiganensis TaxID=28447 RepID=A5CV18_CLAM3|nr:glycosyl hydrolase family 28 protein [Clavibacter michiganensis]MBF4638337.1 polygalacturonase [Clavibacter michiganensis subsp. michiganensis]MBW8027153.1 polygalacturonase [Clavibacter michiganensis subsp. michiganensis]MDO4017251.1 glycosyl hydrolase family 28 protein [Clavibacter michiganensis]MDO4030914.1 glycosyl hydrolase family 28 protein [Clavibacter michiganensis]MDO4037507.1 glycosyl hydrolase family 28 protein [Clavibacter michiganensis]
MGLAPHRIRTLLVDGLLVVAVLASVVTLAAAPPGAASVASAGDAGSAVLGDRRVVGEPAAPTTTCATVPAQVAMAQRQASADDEAHAPDTARIQAALDGCAGSGGAVVLAASSTTAAFLSAPITVRAGEVLVLDPAVVLHASRAAADYQVAGRATCGTVGGAGNGCRPFISLSSHSGLASSAATGLSRGRVDGRGDLPILGGTASWWQVAASAKQAGKQNVPRLVAATRADDVTLHDVDLVDSPGTHVSFDHGDGLTVWGVRIRTPAGARNTDGIDPAGATDVTIARSWISAGDDGIAVKAGTAASAHISVLDDHLFGTHGVAIGSETQAGVSDVLVARVTVSGRDAFGALSVAAGGIRIKSSAVSGGLVQDVEYRDVCVDEVKYPLAFDPRYSSAVGTSIPTMTGIVVDGFRAIRSLHLASSELDGYDAAHPLGLALRGTAVDSARVDMAAADITTAGATFGGVPLASTASDVRVTAGPDAGDPPTCAFPAFPDL